MPCTWRAVRSWLPPPPPPGRWIRCLDCFRYYDAYWWCDISCSVLIFVGRVIFIHHPLASPSKVLTVSINQVYRQASGDAKADWLRRVTGNLKLVAAGLPLNKWTPATLARFAWCARRSTAEDQGVLLPGEEPLYSEEGDADHEFEAYVSRAVINMEPEALDGASAAALLAYHARGDRVRSPAQGRQDALVLEFIADALATSSDPSDISVHDWVTILDSVTKMRLRPSAHADAGQGSDGSGDGAAGGEAAGAEVGGVAGEQGALDRLFQVAGKHLEQVIFRGCLSLSLPPSFCLSPPL